MVFTLNEYSRTDTWSVLLRHKLTHYRPFVIISRNFNVSYAVLSFYTTGSRQYFNRHFGKIHKATSANRQGEKEVRGCWRHATLRGNNTLRLWKLPGCTRLSFW